MSLGSKGTLASAPFLFRHAPVKKILWSDQAPHFFHKEAPMFGAKHGQTEKWSWMHINSTHVFSQPMDPFICHVAVHFCVQAFHSWTIAQGETHLRKAASGGARSRENVPGKRPPHESRSLGVKLTATPWESNNHSI